MLLDERLRKTGQWLFRHRSHTHLVLIPILAVVILLEQENFIYVFPTPTLDFLYVLLCMLITVSGEALRVLTVGCIPGGTSGRNTTAHKAAVLNTSGIYSVVRNPLYLANFLIFFGFSMLFRTWEIVVLNTMFFAATYVPIVLSEEGFLRETFGQSYLDYAQKVPCFLPRLGLWSSPELRWNLRMVIRREHDTMYSIALLFVLLEVSRHYVNTGSLKASVGWLIAGAVATALWLVAEVLKKFTTVLKSR